MKKIVLFIVVLATFAHANMVDMTVYRSKYCGCCEAWSKKIVEQGSYNIKTVLNVPMDRVKKQLSIKPHLQACHTAVIGKYVFEGHIPTADIDKFMDNPPKGALGLAVPGMPIGSQGMEQGNTKDKYAVLLLKSDGTTTVFAKH